ncbi:MAG: hypothetical protein V1932_03730 [Chloroflexota bacterium]
MDVTRSKTFLRSFVEKITIHESAVTIYYRLPVPDHWKETEEVVLPIVPLGGDGVSIGRTFEVAFTLAI